jgi:hypothetical protein
MVKHLIAASVFLSALPAAALAHHGWSSYDASKTVSVTAPLSDVEFRQPHSTAKVVHEGKSWEVILAPPRRMASRGLSEAMLAPDKTVTLEGYARSDGSAEMRIERIKADGKTFELR